MRALANRATVALPVAVVLAFVTYLVSYRRHRTLLLEGLAGRSKHRHLPDALARLLSRSPRQHAILAFMLKTLARSHHHRMIVMGYGGLGFALLLTGTVGMGRVFKPDLVMAASFVYYHVLVLLFLLLAARQLFSYPAELRANWIFRVTESEGRAEWLGAVDRFVLFWGTLLIVVIPLPLEIRSLGVRGAAEVALFGVLGLLTYEWIFSSWNKLPFTCSHLPGRTPAGMVLAFFGLLGALAGVHSTLLVVLCSTPAYLIIISLLLILWIRIHRNRHESWIALRLKYQDLPDPAVHALQLLR